MEDKDSALLPPLPRNHDLLLQSLDVADDGAFLERLRSVITWEGTIRADLRHFAGVMMRCRRILQDQLAASPFITVDGPLPINADDVVRASLAPAECIRFLTLLVHSCVNKALFIGHEVIAMYLGARWLVLADSTLLLASALMEPARFYLAKEEDSYHETMSKDKVLISRLLAIAETWPGVAHQPSTVGENVALPFKRTQTTLVAGPRTLTQCATSANCELPDVMRSFTLEYTHTTAHSQHEPDVALTGLSRLCASQCRLQSAQSVNGWEISRLCVPSIEGISRSTEGSALPTFAAPWMLTAALATAFHVPHNEVFTLHIKVRRAMEAKEDSDSSDGISARRYGLYRQLIALSAALHCDNTALLENSGVLSSSSPLLGEDIAELALWSSDVSPDKTWIPLSAALPRLEEVAPPSVLMECQHLHRCLSGAVQRRTLQSLSISAASALYVSVNADDADAETHLTTESLACAWHLGLSPRVISALPVYESRLPDEMVRNRRLWSPLLSMLRVARNLIDIPSQSSSYLQTTSIGAEFAQTVVGYVGQLLPSIEKDAITHFSSAVVDILLCECGDVDSTLVCTMAAGALSEAVMHESLSSRWMGVALRSIGLEKLSSRLYAELRLHTHVGLLALEHSVSNIPAEDDDFMLGPPALTPAQRVSVLGCFPEYRKELCAAICDVLTDALQPTDGVAMNEVAAISAAGAALLQPVKEVKSESDELSPKVAKLCGMLASDAAMVRTLKMCLTFPAAFGGGMLQVLAQLMDSIVSSDPSLCVTLFDAGVTPMLLCALFRGKLPVCPALLIALPNVLNNLLLTESVRERVRRYHQAREMLPQAEGASRLDATSPLLGVLPARSPLVQGLQGDGEQRVQRRRSGSLVDISSFVADMPLHIVPGSFEYNVLHAPRSLPHFQVVGCAKELVKRLQGCDWDESTWSALTASQQVIRACIFAQVDMVSLHPLTLLECTCSNKNHRSLCTPCVLRQPAHALAISHRFEVSDGNWRPVLSNLDLYTQGRGAALSCRRQGATVWSAASASFDLASLQKVASCHPFAVVAAQSLAEYAQTVHSSAVACEIAVGHADEPIDTSFSCPFWEHDDVSTVMPRSRFVDQYGTLHSGIDKSMLQDLATHYVEGFETSQDGAAVIAEALRFSLVNIASQLVSLRASSIALRHRQQDASAGDKRRRDGLKVETNMPFNGQQGHDVWYTACLNHLSTGFVFATALLRQLTKQASSPLHDRLYAAVLLQPLWQEHGWSFASDEPQLIDVLSYDPTYSDSYCSAEHNARKSYLKMHVRSIPAANEAVVEAACRTLTTGCTLFAAMPLLYMLFNPHGAQFFRGLADAHAEHAFETGCPSFFEVMRELRANVHRPVSGPASPTKPFSERWWPCLQHIIDSMSDLRSYWGKANVCITSLAPGVQLMQGCLTVMYSDPADGSSIDDSAKTSFVSDFLTVFAPSPRRTAFKDFHREVLSQNFPLELMVTSEQRASTMATLYACIYAMQGIALASVIIEDGIVGAFRNLTPSVLLSRAGWDTPMRKSYYNWIWHAQWQRFIISNVCSSISPVQYTVLRCLLDQAFSCVGLLRAKPLRDTAGHAMSPLDALADLFVGAASNITSLCASLVSAATIVPPGGLASPSSEDGMPAKILKFTHLSPYAGRLLEEVAESFGVAFSCTYLTSCEPPLAAWMEAVSSEGTSLLPDSAPGVGYVFDMVGMFHTMLICPSSLCFGGVGGDEYAKLLTQPAVSALFRRSHVQALIQLDNSYRCNTLLLYATYETGFLSRLVRVCSHLVALASQNSGTGLPISLWASIHRHHELVTAAASGDSAGPCALVLPPNARDTLSDIFNASDSVAAAITSGSAKFALFLEHIASFECQCSSGYTMALVRNSCRNVIAANLQTSNAERRHVSREATDEQLAATMAASFSQLQPFEGPRFIQTVLLSVAHETRHLWHGVLQPPAYVAKAIVDVLHSLQLLDCGDDDRPLNSTLKFAVWRSSSGCTLRPIPLCNFDPATDPCAGYSEAYMPGFVLLPCKPWPLQLSRELTDSNHAYCTRCGFVFPTPRELVCTPCGQCHAKGDYSTAVIRRSGAEIPTSQGPTARIGDAASVRSLPTLPEGSIEALCGMGFSRKQVLTALSRVLATLEDGAQEDTSLADAVAEYLLAHATIEELDEVLTVDQPELAHQELDTVSSHKLNNGESSREAHTTIPDALRAAWGAEWHVPQSHLHFTTFTTHSGILAKSQIHSLLGVAVGGMWKMAWSIVDAPHISQLDPSSPQFRASCQQRAILAAVSAKLLGPAHFCGRSLLPGVFMLFDFIRSICEELISERTRTSSCLELAARIHESLEGCNLQQQVVSSIMSANVTSKSWASASRLELLSSLPSTFRVMCRLVSALQFDPSPQSLQCRVAVVRTLPSIFAALTSLEACGVWLDCVDSVHVTRLFASELPNAAELHTNWLLSVQESSQLLEGVLSLLQHSDLPQHDVRACVTLVSQILRNFFPLSALPQGRDILLRLWEQFVSLGFLAVIGQNLQRRSPLPTGCENFVDCLGLILADLSANTEDVFTERVFLFHAQLGAQFSSRADEQVLTLQQVFAQCPAHAFLNPVVGRAFASCIHMASPYRFVGSVPTFYRTNLQEALHPGLDGDCPVDLVSKLTLGRFATQVLSASANGLKLLVGSNASFAQDCDVLSTLPSLVDGSIHSIAEASATIGRLLHQHQKPVTHAEPSAAACIVHLFRDGTIEDIMLLAAIARVLRTKSDTDGCTTVASILQYVITEHVSGALTPQEMYVIDWVLSNVLCYATQRSGGRDSSIAAFFESTNEHDDTHSATGKCRCNSRGRFDEARRVAALEWLSLFKGLARKTCSSDPLVTFVLHRTVFALSNVADKGAARCEKDRIRKCMAMCIVLNELTEDMTASLAHSLTQHHKGIKKGPELDCLATRYLFCKVAKSGLLPVLARVGESFSSTAAVGRLMSSVTSPLLQQLLRPDVLQQNASKRAAQFLSLYRLNRRKMLEKVVVIGSLCQAFDSAIRLPDLPQLDTSPLIATMSRKIQALNLSQMKTVGFLGHFMQEALQGVESYAFSVFQIQRLLITHQLQIEDVAGMPDDGLQAVVADLQMILQHADLQAYQNSEGAPPRMPRSPSVAPAAPKGSFTRASQRKEQSNEVPIEAILNAGLIVEDDHSRDMVATGEIDDDDMDENRSDDAGASDDDLEDMDDENASDDDDQGDESASRVDIDGVFIQSASVDGSSVADNTFEEDYGSIASEGTRNSFPSDNQSGDGIDDTSALHAIQQEESESLDMRMHGSSIVSADEFADEEPVGGGDDDLQGGMQFPWAGVHADEDDDENATHELVFDHNSLLLSHSLWDAGLRVDVDAVQDGQEEEAQSDHMIDDESGVPDLARYLQLQAQPFSRRGTRRPRDHHGNDPHDTELLHEIELALRQPAARRRLNTSKDVAPSDLVHAQSAPGVPAALLGVIIEAIFRFAASSSDSHLVCCPLFSRPKHFQPEHPVWRLLCMPAGLTYSPEPISVGEVLASADSLKFVDAVHTVYAALEPYIADVAFASYLPTGIVAVASLAALPCAASTYAYLLSPDKTCVVSGGSPYVGAASIKVLDSRTVLEEYRPTGERYSVIGASTCVPKVRHMHSNAEVYRNSSSVVATELDAPVPVPVVNDWACCKLVSELHSEVSSFGTSMHHRLEATQAQVRAQLQSNWEKLFEEIAATLDSKALTAISQQQDTASALASLIRTAGEHAKCDFSNLHLESLDANLEEGRSAVLTRWSENLKALAGDVSMPLTSQAASNNDLTAGDTVGMMALFSFLDVPALSSPLTVATPEDLLQHLFGMRHRALRSLIERTPAIVTEIQRRAGILLNLRCSRHEVQGTEGVDAVELLFGSVPALQELVQSCMDAFELIVTTLNGVDKIIGQPFAAACGACLAMHATDTVSTSNEIFCLSSISSTANWHRLYAFMSVVRRAGEPLKFASADPANIASQDDQQLCIPMFGLEQLYVDSIYQDLKACRESFVEGIQSALATVLDTTHWIARRCIAWLQFCHVRDGSPGPGVLREESSTDLPAQSLLLDLSAFRHLLPRQEAPRTHVEFDLSRLVVHPNMQETLAALVDHPHAAFASSTRNNADVIQIDGNETSGWFPIFSQSEISHDKLGVMEAARTTALASVLDVLRVKLVIGYRYTSNIEMGAVEEVKSVQEVPTYQVIHGASDVPVEGADQLTAGRSITRSSQRNGGLVTLAPVAKRILSGRRTSKVAASLQLSSVAGSVEIQGMRAFSQASFSLLTPTDLHKGKEDVFPLFCQLQRIGVQQYSDIDSEFAMWWPIDKTERRPHAGRFKAFFPVLLHRTIALRHFATSSGPAIKIEALALYDVPTPAMASDRKLAAAIWSGRAFPRALRGNALHSLLPHLLDKVLDQSVDEDVAATIACNLCANDAARRQLLDIIVRLCSSGEVAASSQSSAESQRAIRRAHFLLKRILSRFPTAVFSVLDQRSRDKFSATSGVKRKRDRSIDNVASPHTPAKLLRADDSRIPVANSRDAEVELEEDQPKSVLQQWMAAISNDAIRTNQPLMLEHVMILLSMLRCMEPTAAAMKEARSLYVRHRLGTRTLDMICAAWRRGSLLRHDAVRMVQTVLLDMCSKGFVVPRTTHEQLQVLASEARFALTWDERAQLVANNVSAGKPPFVFGSHELQLTNDHVRISTDGGAQDVAITTFASDVQTVLTIIQSVISDMAVRWHLLVALLRFCQTVLGSVHPTCSDVRSHALATAASGDILLCFHTERQTVEFVPVPVEHIQVNPSTQACDVCVRLLLSSRTSQQLGVDLSHLREGCPGLSPCDDFPHDISSRSIRECIVRPHGEVSFWWEPAQGYECPACAARFPAQECAEARYSRGELLRHCIRYHDKDETTYVCPICAAMPGADPNKQSRNFSGHLNLRHNWCADHHGYGTGICPPDFTPPPVAVDTEMAWQNKEAGQLASAHGQSAVLSGTSDSITSLDVLREAALAMVQPEEGLPSCALHWSSIAPVTQQDACTLVAALLDERSNSDISECLITVLGLLSWTHGSKQNIFSALIGAAEKLAGQTCRDLAALCERVIGQPSTMVPPDVDAIISSLGRHPVDEQLIVLLSVIKQIDEPDTVALVEQSGRTHVIAALSQNSLVLPTVTDANFDYNRMDEIEATPASRRSHSMGSIESLSEESDRLSAFSDVWQGLHVTLKLVTRNLVLHARIEEHAPGGGASQRTPASMDLITKAWTAVISRFSGLILGFFEANPVEVDADLSSTAADPRLPATKGPLLVEKPRTISQPNLVAVSPVETITKPGAFAESARRGAMSLTHRRVSTFIEAHREVLNEYVRSDPTLLSDALVPFAGVKDFRVFLDFSNKTTFFRSQLKHLFQNRAQAAPIQLRLRRKHVFQDSFVQFQHLSGEQLRGVLDIRFKGEEGVDAGGLTKEWYEILAREMFNPDYALFQLSEDGTTFQPNPMSGVNDDHLSYFRFVGKVLGKAVADGQLLDAHFTRSFYKHILGISVTYHDIEAIDPQFYKSLNDILNMDIDDLGLELYFAVEEEFGGSVSVVELIPGGKDRLVTDANKWDYVQLVTSHKMISSIMSQTNALLAGFHELIPPSLISMFTESELELLIAGLPTIDISDLKANTEYVGFRQNDEIVQWFWEALEHFDQQDRAKFLMFVTGTSKVPPGGFKSLRGQRGPQKFTIEKSFGGEESLPQAHTCFNTINIPCSYNSSEVLEEKLLMAIREGGEGFGLV